jgi:hypothetical protein
VAQKTNCPTLQNQINAGTAGRNRGHAFESLLTESIKVADISLIEKISKGHRFYGNPTYILLNYISKYFKEKIVGIENAWWLGGLATSGKGDILCDSKGNPIKGSKSDIIIDIIFKSGKKRIGISVKTCNNKTPTNDQLFFTTALAFCKLLNDNGISVSDTAISAMRMFCGDTNFRPCDLLNPEQLKSRVSDSKRYFWEELPAHGRNELETIFGNYQDNITRLLLQKAYKNEPYAPEFVLHQETQSSVYEKTNIAIFHMDELIKQSKKHQGFVLSKYVIRKGTYKHDNAEHLAPRFGFIQFQRGGQKQHPTQLQFNLKAGYFNHLFEESDE